MKDNFRFVMFATLIMITVLMCMSIAWGAEKVTYPKVIVNNNQDAYCFIEVKMVIEKDINGDDIVTKKEILKCSDGREGVSGPSYWELFAQFYYRDITTPEYCRFYSRPGHVFKSFGKVCLNKDGEWEVR